MVALVLKFRSKEEMQEWVEDKQHHGSLPYSATVRPEDGLDKFDERYVLVRKLSRASITRSGARE